MGTGRVEPPDAADTHQGRGWRGRGGPPRACTACVGAGALGNIA